MPFSSSFAKALKGVDVVILPQPGWGWRKLLETGESRAFDPPKVVMKVKAAELVQPADEVLGFAGVVESDHAEFHGLSLMAFAHSTEKLSEEDVVPLSIAMSPGMPKWIPDPGALSGYNRMPDGCPAFLGFGMLVPRDIGDITKA